MFGFSEFPKRLRAGVQHPTQPAANSVPQTSNQKVQVKRGIASQWQLPALVLLQFFCCLEKEALIDQTSTNCQRSLARRQNLRSAVALATGRLVADEDVQLSVSLGVSVVADSSVTGFELSSLEVKAARTRSCTLSQIPFLFLTMRKNISR